MIKKLGKDRDLSKTAVKIANALYPSPFETGLEYSPPARGVWNIVHTGMLIPESHEIFICAPGCLRGVVLTAAEMGLSERFSTVAIKENNVIDGDMEELIIDGVSDILGKLPKMPKAVLVYTSCIHHFMACDIERCYSVLRKRFPETEFTDCYMTPIMRKSGLTPDQLMRSRLYSFLKPCSENRKSINITGSDLRTDGDSELVKMINDNGFTLREIMSCKSYTEYLEMAESFLNIALYPPAKAGSEELCGRLGRKFLYMPFLLDYDEIEKQLSALAEMLEVEYVPDKSLREKADSAMKKAKEAIKDTPIPIDYTAFSHPFQLALFLIKHSFNVTDIYADSVSSEDKKAFDELKTVKPSLEIHPTVHPEMSSFGQSEGKVLAIGQKAAYFTGTDSFVNIVEDGGLHGFCGIEKLAEMMTDAYMNPKQARNYIQEKGLGCSGGCCL